MLSKIKQVVFNIRLIISLVLLRDFGNIIYDIAQKYYSLDVSELRKCEQLHHKAKKAELDVTFLSNCKSLQVFPKFLCFSIPHSNDTDKVGIRKRLLKSALAKRIKEKCRLTAERNKHDIKIS